MIHGVERLGPEFETRPVMQRNQPGNANVPVVHARTGEDVRAGVAEHVRPGHGKAGGIDPVMAVAADVLIAQV